MTAREGVAVVVLLAIVALVYVGMRAGWKRRARTTGALVPTLPTAPADPGAVRLGPVDATYVSTTTAGDWLDRVVAHDLGVRSQASVTVHDAGVSIARTGAADVFVPAGSLTDTSTAPGMAGKFVGKDGLVVLTWAPTTTPGAPLLDTGLRPHHSADGTALVAAVSALIATKEKA
ncbi:hypothetical protein IC607_07335 [Cellulomonas sp. JH27-2]|uniref:PH-like domain-containing protein n=1 Tax=Cellulomonas sp. JH27-2 TaxID=2774139 RepID=UPI00177F2C76|nr:hypothetical protein [Cellulomonas sp. JH27-2]MBD8058777.1 hypothetical protein [Cellulomonas sp. JH27-2]